MAPASGSGGICVCTAMTAVCVHSLYCCYVLLVGGAVQLSTVGIRRRRSATLGHAAPLHCSRRRQRPFTSLRPRPLHRHRPRRLSAWRTTAPGIISPTWLTAVISSSRCENRNCTVLVAVTNVVVRPRQFVPLIVSLCGCA